jgi:uncharacterized protein (DUF305 family)
VKLAMALLLATILTAGCAPKRHHSVGHGMDGGMGTMKASSGAMVTEMKDMNAAMAADLRNSGSKHDEAFINMMLEHHKGAVLMAEVALEESQKPEIRQLSSEIIAAQTKEIELLHTWRKEWYDY